MSKQKKIEAYKAQIPTLLKTFTEFLETKGLTIDTFQYNEVECDQIESIMRNYFKGHETEYLDIDDYRPMFKKPELLKVDVNFDGYSAYIGELMINNTDCEYDILTGNVIFSGDITYKFKNIGRWSITPRIPIYMLLRHKLENNSIYGINKEFIDKNNDINQK